MTSTIFATTWNSTPFNNDKYNFIDKLKLFDGGHIEISPGCKYSQEYLHADHNTISDTQQLYRFPNRQQCINNTCAKEATYGQKCSYPIFTYGSNFDIKDNSGIFSLSSQTTSTSSSYCSDESIPSCETTYESSDDSANAQCSPAIDEMCIDNNLLPIMTLISPYRHLEMSPSYFLNGCVCGHNFEFRDMVYESRKRKYPKSLGVTIRPKTIPISAKLRCI
jgi:hypothetical protein